MILHLYKDKSKTPHTTFDEYQDWSCSLVHFIARFDRLTESGIYYISTDLIRREENQQRILFHIHLTQGTNHFTFTPTQKMKYKLRLHDVSSAVFNFYRLDQRPIVLSDFTATFDIGNDRFQSVIAESAC